MNSNPNQMHAQMPLLLAEIVLASAKNVNRLRALRRHRCRQALSKPPIMHKTLQSHLLSTDNTTTCFAQFVSTVVNNTTFIPVERAKEQTQCGQNKLGCVAWSRFKSQEWGRVPAVLVMAALKTQPRWLCYPNPNANTSTFSQPSLLGVSSLHS